MQHDQQAQNEAEPRSQRLLVSQHLRQLPPAAKANLSIQARLTDRAASTLVSLTAQMDPVSFGIPATSLHGLFSDTMGAEIELTSCISNTAPPATSRIA